jgi:hypothetical protein
MNAKDKGSLIGPGEKVPAGWRSSLYDEPMWLSVAWIVGPALLAAIGIYFAVR